MQNFMDTYKDLMTRVHIIFSSCHRVSEVIDGVQIEALAADVELLTQLLEVFTDPRSPSGGEEFQSTSVSLLMFMLCSVFRMSVFVHFLAFLLFSLYFLFIVFIVFNFLFSSLFPSSLTRLLTTSYCFRTCHRCHHYPDPFQSGNHEPCKPLDVPHQCRVSVHTVHVQFDLTV